MKKLLLIIFYLPIFGFGQATYNITVNTSNAWSGNLFFQKGGQPIKPVKIIDSTGNEIFSQNMSMKGWDFKVNYNNKLSYFDRSSKGWFIMDSLQNEVDSVYFQNGYIADNHDFLALANGNYVLIAYDEQPYAMDTVVSGGDPNAIVEGLIIQELDSNHNVIFEWKSWDHFHVTDNIYLSPWTGSNLNFIHANAIDIDFDGHFIISSRNLDEITKIHRTSGEIIWRWGGSQNEFTFVNDYPFTHQHTIKSLGGNRYLLYDNGNHSGQYYASGNNVSRAVEYELDTNLMEATKVWEFIHPDSLYTPSTGGVQRLPNGNTLINFGNLQWLNTGSIVTEVDNNNQIVFQLEYNYGGNLYRAQKFDWFFFTPIIGCTDSLACNYDSLATIDNSSCIYLNISISISNTSCDGSTDGSIVATANGGATPNYQYSLGGGLSQANGTFSNLSAGTYFIDVTDINGCSSNQIFTITDPLPLVLNNTINGCDSVLIGSNYYSISGAYTDSLISVNGCDSVVNTNLTIEQNTSSYDTLSVGSGIVWNGIPLSASGDYSVTLINSIGCDSIVNLNLTVTTTGISNIDNNKRNLVRIADMLGQETPYRRNAPLLYFYDDGKVEKRIVIE